MFGRVKASSSSLDCLELETRSYSKITKNDALSIYEATLEKLRLGSRRSLNPPPEEDMMKIDNPHSSPEVSKPNSNDALSIINTKQQNKEDSDPRVFALFSKCKSSSGGVVLSLADEHKV